MATPSPSSDLFKQGTIVDVTTPTFRGTIRDQDTGLPRLYVCRGGNESDAVLIARENIHPAPATAINAR